MRIRVRKGAMAMATGAVGLALALAGCSGEVLGHPGYRPMAPTGPSGVGTTLVTGPWVIKADISVGNVTSLVQGPDAVYALASDPSLDNVARVPQQLIRIANGSNAVTKGPFVLATSGLAILGKYPWVVALDNAGGETLDQLNPTTLAIRGSVSLPGASYSGSSSLASAPGASLWVGSGNQLYRVTVTTGVVTEHITVTGQITDLAVSPAGSLLYSADEVSGSLVVTERNTVSGALMATSADFYSVNGGRLAPTVGGVWASFRSGMVGGAVLLGAGSLGQLVPKGGAVPPVGRSLMAVMGVTASVSAGDLWLSTYQTLACADPATGQVRAEEPVTDGIAGKVVAAPGTVYVPTDTGIEVLQPPLACGLGRNVETIVPPG